VGGRATQTPWELLRDGEKGEETAGGGAKGNPWRRAGTWKGSSLAIVGGGGSGGREGAWDIRRRETKTWVSTVLFSQTQLNNTKFKPEGG